MDFLAGLNPQQMEAVRHVEGPLLILAGAGSGKTRVITHRMAHMICECGIAPWNLLAVTFTNKAAGEMRERVKKLLEGRVPGEGPTVSTFHSFCVRLLRRNGEKLADIRPNFTRNFTIYDDDDQVRLLKSIYKQLAIDDKALPPRSALSMISKAKCAKTSPEEMANQARDPVSKNVSVLYERYEGALRTANAMDFDDLLLETVRLLEHDAGTRQYWNDRIHYLMIDEYQDTNRNQYDLMRLLAGGRNNVCVVGDEDQSIYSWRGADIRNILDFEKDFGQAKVIRLEQNYRSTKSILEAAGAVVANNIERKGKTLWTAGAPGDLITLYEALDGENEALWIAETIDRTMKRDPDAHFAVLYRTNFQSRQIEEALRRYGKKYNVVGGLSFYQRAEIKDMLAYLRILLTPTDNMGFLRIVNTPARGIGKSTVEQLDAYAVHNELCLWDALGQMVEARQLGARAEAALNAFRDLIVDLRNISDRPVNQVIDAVIEKTGYIRMLEMDKSEDAEGRIDNINELVNAAAEASERGENIAAFLDHAALVSDADQVDERSQISLLTIHNAKGLEFPVVFIAGLEEGLFPHIRSIDSPSMIEEERRLCYVGMTRAEVRLYLSWARARRRFGGGPAEPSIASRFLREVPPNLLKKLGGAASYGSYGGRGDVELFSEQYEVRHSARKNLYTGKTYNSVENVAHFFKERGADPRPFANRTPPVAPAAKSPPAQHSLFSDSEQPPQAERTPPPRQAPPVTQQRPVGGKPPVKKGKLHPGSSIVHPTYGKGTIVRKEGEGPDAKLTVSFPGYGLKKLIAKYAGLRDE
ncbi:MAG: UvrD-helicase domain-containing protein [Acidobacteria bacterium]|nr:UvrD-helicase domain-containing protein [Acidobacteriota bacterium]